MIHQVPIKSLPQEWLWCETWCDDSTKKTAKTIDLVRKAPVCVCVSVSVSVSGRNTQKEQVNKIGHKCNVSEQPLEGSE